MGFIPMDTEKEIINFPKKPTSPLVAIQMNISDRMESPHRSFFDPNSPKYNCLCGQCHSTTGVTVIAGLLWLTVALEIWHLLWSLATGSTESAILSSAFQLGIGSAIAFSVVLALKRENAALLSPYLLLQTVGLAAGFVILFALLYITLGDDVSTIRAFLESHGPHVEIDKEDETYLIYMGWIMVGSCVVVLALQFWLISVVFACWRYFRDKRECGYSKEFKSSSFVVLRPLSTRNEIKNAAVVSRLVRSVSVDEMFATYQPIAHHRPAAATISYDFSTKDTVIIA